MRSPPERQSANSLTDAVAGGLMADLGLTALMIAGEKKSGKASELVELERAGCVNARRADA